MMAEVCRPLTGFERKLEVGRKVVPPPLWVVEQPDIIEKLTSQPGRLRAALTGGIASGKSTVAELFIAFGAAHIDFDLLAREAVAPGSAGFQAAVDLFGPKFLQKDGNLDRGKISKAVFKKPDLKARLENIIHPLTWEFMSRELDLLAKTPLTIISIPLLFEAGLETFFPTIILSYINPEEQRRRLLARDKRLNRWQAKKIIQSQWPISTKIGRASHIIDNSGSLASTIRQCKAMWQTLFKT